MGHIINLAVQAFLFQNDIDIETLKSYDEIETRGEEVTRKEEIAHKFRLLSPLGKLHNIVIHSHDTANIDKFKALAGRLVPLDNRTRWNSWYMCLVIALDVDTTVDTFTKNHWQKLHKDFVNPQEWKRLYKIKDFLYLFYRATLNT
jgi:hypothetical protein